MRLVSGGRRACFWREAGLLTEPGASPGRLAQEVSGSPSQMSATATFRDDDPMQTSSPSLRMTGVDRALRGESPFVCGPRFAAGNIGGQFRKLVQKAGRSKPEQHRHHH